MKKTKKTGKNWKTICGEKEYNGSDKEDLQNENMLYHEVFDDDRDFVVILEFSSRANVH